MSDERLRELLGELRDLIHEGIDAQGTPRTDEVRLFINKHRDMSRFKHLALTMILLAEAFKAADEGEE